ncbi:MAG: hypothetical protein QNJ19_08705 [Woeseiaceae bacterium]|nr:hypothetical protein [Woeseiaceae bacterium]
MNNRLTIALLSVLILLSQAACGDGGSEEGDARDFDSPLAEDGGASLADLPDDFPPELIPPSYDRIEYTDMSLMGGTRGVSFEVTGDVQASIDHYTALLGEPTLSVEAQERLVQWQTTPFKPWIFSVMGTADETIVAASALPE